MVRLLVFLLPCQFEGNINPNYFLETTGDTDAVNVVQLSRFEWKYLALKYLIVIKLVQAVVVPKNFTSPKKWLTHLLETWLTEIMYKEMHIFELKKTVKSLNHLVQYSQHEQWAGARVLINWIIKPYFMSKDKSWSKLLAELRRKSKTCLMCATWRDKYCLQAMASLNGHTKNLEN